jgi:hypothetical protein
MDKKNYRPIELVKMNQRHPRRDGKTEEGSNVERALSTYYIGNNAQYPCRVKLNLMPGY